MTDPREAKLPKWAQAALEVERTRSALSWPTEPDPTPKVVFDGASGIPTSGDVGDATLWVWAFNAYTAQVAVVYIRGGHVYRSIASASSYLGGSRPNGPFYATEGDARLALRWAVARRCAAELRKVGN